MTKHITIRMELIDPLGNKVYGQIVVTKGYACSTFTDKHLAKKLYDSEIKTNKNIVWNSRINGVIQKYEGKDIKEIVKILIKELKKTGGKYEIIT